MNRVTFNEITKTGVTEGMAHPRTIDLNLVNAQQARRILDRLVGYSLSPFLAKTIRRGLSAGRVQSVALRIIVDREEEIRKFKPEEYWSIDARLTAEGSRSIFGASFYGDRSGEIKITNKEQADAILAALGTADFRVDSVKKGKKNKQPAPPFITSTLQQEASRKLGFQAQAHDEGRAGAVRRRGDRRHGRRRPHHLHAYRLAAPFRGRDSGGRAVHRRPLGQELPAREAAPLQGAQERAGRPRGDPSDVRRADAEGRRSVADEGPVQVV